MNGSSIKEPIKANINIAPRDIKYEIEKNRTSIMKKKLPELNKVSSQKDVTIDLSQFLEPTSEQENRFINYNNKL